MQKNFVSVDVSFFAEENDSVEMFLQSGPDPAHELEKWCHLSDDRWWHQNDEWYPAVQGCLYLWKENGNRIGKTDKRGKRHAGS